MDHREGSIVSLTICTDKNSMHSLPNDKILDSSKLKALADDKIYVTEKLKFVLRRVETIVGKGENCGYRKAFYKGVIKSRDCVVKS